MDENEVLEDSNQSEEIVETTSEASPEPQDTREIVERELDKLEESPKEEKPPEPEEPKQEAVKESKADEPSRNPWKSWKKDIAEKLSKLPKDIQDGIIERQEQFHKGIEQYKEAANYGKMLDKSIAPYKDYLTQLGVSPDVAFPNLLKTEYTLRMGSPTEKAEMLQKLAHDYGIDLGQLASMPYDPQMGYLKSQLDLTRAQLEASNSFRQSHEDAQIQNHIEDFATGREFFEDVRLIMADLLDRGLATDLDDAYAKAVRLDDGVFEKYQAQQLANSQRQQLSKADQAAKAAKAAAVSVKGSPVGVKNMVAPTSTEDAVRMAMRQHGIL